MCTYQRALVLHETTINQLNVFPVPDGDTGTNMRSTIDAVLLALNEARESEQGVAKAIASGSLLGARGNSGIILAQFLRVMVGAFDEIEVVGPHEFAAAMSRAGNEAYLAVGQPCEGTMLSVARGAALRGEAAASAGEDLLGVARACLAGSIDALFATPSQLQILAASGVVDSGGAGLTLFFAAFVHHLTGESSEIELFLPAFVHETLRSGFGLTSTQLSAGRNHYGESYELMFLFEGTDQAVHDLRESWSKIGSSVVIVGEQPTWNCHVHTFDVGRAIESAIEVGRPYEIRVTNLDRQVEEEAWVRSSLSQPRVQTYREIGESGTANCAVVAVVNGEGLEKVLSSLGVAVIVHGGVSMNPSTKEIFDAIALVHASEVIVLPNDKNVVAIAQQAAKLDHRNVQVLETTSVQQAISVMLEFDPTRQAKENLELMMVSLGRVTTGEVIRSIRDTVTKVGAIRRGDYLAIRSLEIIAIGQSLCAATIELVGALIRDTHEIVTLYSGDGIGGDEIEEIVTALQLSYPKLTIECIDGGQAHAQMLVALE
jgi:hypothetical protein